MEQCIICYVAKKDHLSQISASSLENIQHFSQKWAEIGRNTEIFKRTSSLTLSETAVHQYHRKCYQSLCHHTHLRNAQKKHEEHLQSTASRKKRSNTTDGASTSKSRKLFDHELCLFCQQRDNTDIHNVTTEDMGKKFLSIKVSSRNDDIRARFAFIHDQKDAFAQNMKCHLNCLRKETRHTKKEGNTDGSDERDYIAGAICDIEMIRVLSNDGVDMNSVHDSYISLRNEHGVHTIPGRNYKPDVKDILLENIPDIKFVKRGGPKPEIALSQRTADKVLKEYCDEAEVNKDMNILCKAAAITRKEIENTKD